MTYDWICTTCGEEFYGTRPSRRGVCPNCGDLDSWVGLEEYEEDEADPTP